MNVFHSQKEKGASMTITSEELKKCSMSPIGSFERDAAIEIIECRALIKLHENRIAEQQTVIDQRKCECDRLITELAALREQKPRLKPHKYRECVNGLLEEAIAYSGTQQLRERISARLGNFIQPDHEHAPAAPVAVPDEMLCDFYEVGSFPDLVKALVLHVEQLQESAKRNVKPWEDTFPETLLPAYIERIKAADEALSQTNTPVAVPDDVIDKIVPAINPDGLDQEEHHCEFTLYQDRERIRKELKSLRLNSGSKSDEKV